MTWSAITFLVFSAAVMEPEIPVIGQAPVADGDTVAAKQHALDDALRQAAEKAFDRTLAEAGLGLPLPAGLADLRVGVAGRARRYVRSYRIIDQGEVDGIFHVSVLPEMDRVVLAREIERTAAATKPAPVEKVGVPSPVLLVRTGNSLADTQAAQAVAAALLAAGVRAVVASDTLPAENETAQVGRLVSKFDGSVALVLMSAVVSEGVVRGAGLRAVECRIGARVFAAGSGALAENASRDRAFATTDGVAQKECLAKTAQGVTAAALPSLAAAAAGLSVGAHAVTLVLDLIEPAALGPTLRALGKVAGVSSSEVRRIALGVVEIRVTTRLPPGALVAALAKELQGTLDVGQGKAVGDSVQVSVRLFSGATP